MQTESSPNRVEADLQQWQAKEQSFSQLFSFNVTRNKAFLQEKLQYYHQIASRYKSSASPDEKLTLKLIKQEQKQIEQKLYPNLLVRLLRKLTLESIRQKQTVHTEIKEKAQAKVTLRNSLQKAGFGQVISLVEQNIQKGLDQFTIPVTESIDRKDRMDFALSFKRNTQGQYTLESYHAALQNESLPNRSHTFHLSDSSVTANQAYQLLSGRAAYIQSPDNGQGKWVQLDFSDRDVAGNYRLQQFSANYSDTLKQQLKELPLEQKHNEQAMQKLLENLSSGQRSMVFLQKDGLEQKYFLEASPKENTLTLYDYQMKKISLEAVLEKKENQRQTQRVQMAKTIPLHPGKAKRNGLSIS